MWKLVRKTGCKRHIDNKRRTQPAKHEVDEPVSCSYINITNIVLKVGAELHVLCKLEDLWTLMPSDPKQNDGRGEINQT